MLKILALTLALLPLSAQGDLVQKYIGKWAGTANTTTKGKFKVTAVIRRAGENLKVSYVSKGQGGSSAGSILAVPKGDGACYSANLAAAVNPAIPMNADICLDEYGNAAITSMMANGSATLSETGKTCSFSIRSPLGSATGTFRKVPPGKKRRAK